MTTYFRRYIYPSTSCCVFRHLFVALCSNLTSAFSDGICIVNLETIHLHPFHTLGVQTRIMYEKLTWRKCFILALRKYYCQLDWQNCTAKIARKCNRHSPFIKKVNGRGQEDIEPKITKYQAYHIDSVFFRIWHRTQMEFWAWLKPILNF